MTSNDTRKQDLADAKAWLCARWHQKHPNEQHIIQLADYATHLRPTPKPPAGGECPCSPDSRHQVDTSMESGPNNCFHCEAPMGGSNAR